MKAIAGIVRFDTQPAEKALLGQMLAHSQRANAQTFVHWGKGPVALGSVNLHGVAQDTNEDLRPRLVTASLFPHLQIVFDGRIDNRKALLAQVGADAHAGWRDDELVLACYAKWGDEMPAHLIGDYAFAIWDEARHTLFCARDHFGLRPFYMYHGPRFFVFASDMAALLAHPEVPRRINELRVAFHLVAHPPENRLTFYQGIERLSPAHSLTVTREGATRLRQFWRLDEISELRLHSDAEYAEAFCEIFQEAVACRIPEERPIGVSLSGGLDSTAVAAMLRHVLGAGSNGDAGSMLHSFSAYFAQTPECDERHYIDATLQMGGITPHFVDVEAASPLARLEEMVAALGEPISSPTMYIPWQTYEAASRAGVGVVFDGIDGDTAVHHGDAYLAELARAGRWADFFSLAAAIAERKKQASVSGLLYRYGDPYLKSLTEGGQWFKLYQEARGIAPHTRQSARRIFYNYIRELALRPLAVKAGLRRAQLPEPRSAAGLLENGVISQTLAHQTGILDHLRAGSTELPATSRQEHYQLLTAPIQSYAFEVSMRVAQIFGIEVRQPFTDRRLIEFCYALPPQQKVEDGWTRNIVRRGLAGILPEAIRLRGDKTTNSRAVTKGLLHRDAQHLERMLGHDSAQLAHFIDMPKLQTTINRYRSSGQEAGNRADEILIWQSITLAEWLHQRKEDKKVGEKIQAEEMVQAT